MPKYKDSPEVRATKKERKEKLREFLSLLDVEEMRIVYNRIRKSG